MKTIPILGLSLGLLAAAPFARADKLDLKSFMTHPPNIVRAVWKETQLPDSPSAKVRFVMLRQQPGAFLWAEAPSLQILTNPIALGESARVVAKKGNHFWKIQSQGPANGMPDSSMVLSEHYADAGSPVDPRQTVPIELQFCQTSALDSFFHWSLEAVPDTLQWQGDLVTYTSSGNGTYSQALLFSQDGKPQKLEVTFYKGADRVLNEGTRHRIEFTYNNPNVVALGIPSGYRKTLYGTNFTAPAVAIVVDILDLQTASSHLPDTFFSPATYLDPNAWPRLQHDVTTNGVTTTRIGGVTMVRPRPLLTPGRKTGVIYAGTATALAFVPVLLLVRRKKRPGNGKFIVIGIAAALSIGITATALGVIPECWTKSGTQPCMAIGSTCAGYCPVHVDTMLTGMEPFPRIVDTLDIPYLYPNPLGAHIGTYGPCNATCEGWCDIDKLYYRTWAVDAPLLTNTIPTQLCGSGS